MVVCGHLELRALGLFSVLRIRRVEVFRALG